MWIYFPIVNGNFCYQKENRVTVKKYLTDKLFNLFELFYKHRVFLEISIPSVSEIADSASESFLPSPSYCL